MHARIERLRPAGPGRVPALGIVALMAFASTAAAFAHTTAAAAQYVQFGGLPTKALGPGPFGTGALYYQHAGRTDSSFADLRRDCAAIIIAVGAKASRGLGLEGEHGPGVFGGGDLLRAVALGQSLDMGRDVVVGGGGNVAYDVARTLVRQIAYDTARTAARLPATSRVRLVSLEGLEEMPADTIEIIEGDEEGIERLNGWGPVEIARDAQGAVTGVVFRRCLRVYDEQRRFSPQFDDQDRLTIACDTVLLAVGQAPAIAFLEDGGSDVRMARPGWPKADPATLSTTAPGIFVAGDLAHGTRLLIDAVASGKAAVRLPAGLDRPAAGRVLGHRCTRPVVPRLAAPGRASDGSRRGAANLNRTANSLGEP